jgi:hypothetical protein
VDLLISLHVRILLHAGLPLPCHCLLLLPLFGGVLAVGGGLRRPHYMCRGHLDVLLLLCSACSVMVVLLLLQRLLLLLLLLPPSLLLLQRLLLLLLPSVLLLLLPLLGLWA